MTEKFSTLMVICFLSGLALALEVEAVPVITAKDGILYQDDQPCFLAGPVAPAGYYGFSVHSQSPAILEFVPGHQGKGLKISFGPKKVSDRGSRWVDFPGFDSRLCVDGKAKYLKLWVKGDGSSNAITFKVENYAGKVIAGANLGEFSLLNTNWTQFVFPLEDKYPVLAQANCACLILSFDQGAPKGFSFVLDDITLDGPSGELVVCDFDKKMVFSNIYWSNPNGREKFKDDPVYKALRDDPLYKEISGENFQTVGMNTFHLSITSVGGTVLQTGDLLGDACLCGKLSGMPMVPEFMFKFGAYNGGQEAEEWARKIGLPETVLRRSLSGSPAGGFDAICFEDPIGNKIHQEGWQSGTRNLLEHGGNIYAYELINENSGYYGCACRQNKEMFISRLKAQYRDIAKLNESWGAHFKSFEEIISQLPRAGSADCDLKGLRVEWEKFMGNRYVEILQQGGKWIHAIEDELKKPHGLIGQMGDAGWDFYGSGGADMYKMARGLDVIETEGGVGFGDDSYSGEVNPLTLVMSSRGDYHHQMASDLADAVCPDKPIINTEHYVIRYRGKAREPTTKADIITSIWEEFLRGASSVHTYQLGGGSYLDREEALAEGARNQCLLSPYVYPRESLNGYKEVQEEIRRVADVVMNRPRLGRTAECAVLFSRPTIRYLIGVPSYLPDWKKDHPFYRSHETIYDYLSENHIPMRYLYEEQLPEGSAGKYRIMITPHSDNIYPETLKFLADYAKKGGTLICFGDALRYDEYGNERYAGESSVLLGLERTRTNAFVETVALKDGGCVKAFSKREVVPGAAEVVVKFPERGTPFITRNKFGKGNVYYINADASRLGETAGPLLDYLTAQVQLAAPLEVRDMDGNQSRSVEANVIPKGEQTVIFLVNWKAYLDRVVKVKFRELKDRDRYYVADIAKNSLYTKNGRDEFSGQELKEGGNLLLPSQERVVLLVTKKRYAAASKPIEMLTDDGARELNKKIQKELEDKLVKEAKAKEAQREIVFGLIGPGDHDKIKECIRSAGGDAITGVALLKSTSGWEIQGYGLREGTDSVLTYVLIFKDGMKAGEIEAVQEKVLGTLVERFNARIIKGQSREEFLKAQSYTELGHCEALDIRKQMNMGFVDEKADDQKGGLFDEGRSLSNFPVGSQKFSGVPFEISDPAQNNGVSCIVLRGQTKSYFPERVTGIVVGRKANNIYLLHTAGYCSGDAVVYRLRLNYADGTSADIDVKAGNEIKDWFNRPQTVSLSNAKLAWQGKAQEKRGTAADSEEKTVEYDVAIYCARLANPHPEKEIRTLDLISANNAAVPAIFGMTAEE